MKRSIFAPYKAKPKIQPDNIEYIESLDVTRRGEILYSGGKSLATLMDLIAGQENLYVTIGSRYDRLGYYASIKIADGEPIKMYGTNLINFFEAIASTLEELDVSEFEEELSEPGEIPF